MHWGTTGPWAWKSDLMQSSPCILATCSWCLHLANVKIHHRLNPEMRCLVAICCVNNSKAGEKNIDFHWSLKHPAQTNLWIRIPGTHQKNCCTAGHTNDQIIRLDLQQQQSSSSGSSVKARSWGKLRDIGNMYANLRQKQMLNTKFGWNPKP
jgi:hypothetical protein